MHAYEDEPHINLGMDAALKQLVRFIPKETRKKIKDVDLFKRSIDTGLVKMGEYQRSISVNMEKEELLRDICFLSAGLIEQHSHISDISEVVYRAMVTSCIDVVEAKIKGEFHSQFILKLKQAYTVYWVNNGVQHSFNATAIYLMFKSHLRIITTTE